VLIIPNFKFLCLKILFSGLSFVDWLIFLIFEIRWKQEEHLNQWDFSDSSCTLILVIEALEEKPNQISKNIEHMSFNSFKIKHEFKPMIHVNRKKHQSEWRRWGMTGLYVGSCKYSLF